MMPFGDFMDVRSKDLYRYYNSSARESISNMFHMGPKLGAGLLTGFDSDAPQDRYPGAPCLDMGCIAQPRLNLGKHEGSVAPTWVHR